MGIDYEKLKQAHDLAARCKSHYLVHIVGKNGNEYTLVDWLPDMPDMNFSDEDALIEKLIELTPSEPKYEVGQDVWFLYMGFEINHFKIQQLFLNNSGEWEYDNVPESDLFTSRESLIESQIQYWQSLTPAQISCSEAIRKHHDFEDDDCQHKEIVTGPYPRSNPPRKCTVCGELYR